MKQGEEPPPTPAGGFNEMEALAELNEDDDLLGSRCFSAANEEFEVIQPSKRLGFMDIFLANIYGISIESSKNHGNGD